MKKKYLLLFAATALALAACKKDDTGGNSSTPAEAPILVSVTPPDGSEVGGTSLTVVFTFDQNVKASSSSVSSLKLEPAATVSRLWASGADVSVQLDDLAGGTAYTLAIPAGTVKGFKSGQEAVAEITYEFSTKEVIVERDYERNPAGSLTNLKATQSAKKLYDALLGIYGKKVVSGACGGSSWDTGFSDFVAAQANCGKYPGVVGFDYLFMHYKPHIWGGSNPPDYSDISTVKAAYDAGNIIQICWHMNMPSAESDFPDHPENYSFYVSNFKGGQVFSASAAVTEGTWQNEAFDYYVEKLAAYLGALQDAGIPVLFRPFHEAAGDYGWANPWFWWGYEGAEPLVKIWKYLKDTLEGTYGINNLIWVYTMQTGYKGALASVADMLPWYPGDDYVDIVGCDLYVNKGTTQSAVFKRVNNAVRGAKMVALSENGNLLDFEKCFEEDAPWLWFMTWNSGSSGNWSLSSDGWSNTAADWKTALTGSHTLNRGELNY